MQKFFPNLQDKRKKRNSKNNLGYLVRTVDFERTFSKGDRTNWNNEICTNTQTIHDSNPKKN